MKHKTLYLNPIEMEILFVRKATFGVLGQKDWSEKRGCPYLRNGCFRFQII